jgi:hypothetical protein
VVGAAAKYADKTHPIGGVPEQAGWWEKTMKPASNVIPLRLAALRQLNLWRAEQAYRARVRQAQIMALSSLDRRRTRPVSRSTNVIALSFDERAREAQRRGFERMMSRLGGGHLY